MIEDVAKTPTESSIERLYIVNQLRDLLHHEDALLVDLGVSRIMVFGSTVNGIAKESSDIDILIILESSGNYTNLRQSMSRLKNDPLWEVKMGRYQFSFDPLPKDRSDYIHVTVLDEDNVIGETIAADAVEIWPKF